MTAATASPADTSFGAAALSESWRRLCTIALIVAAAGDVVAQALAGTVIPPLAGFAVLSLVAAALLRRPGRAGAILGLVVSVLALLAGAPFVVEALAHPESPVDFLHGATSTVFRLVAAVAAVGALRRWSPASARRTGQAAGVIGAAAVVVALASALLVGSDAAVAGDTTVVASGAAWGAETVTVESGEAVFVDNTDGMRHTFTVEGTEVSAELPAWQSRRVAIDLPPGQYSLICEVPGHETMTATLDVR